MGVDDIDLEVSAVQTKVVDFIDTRCMSGVVGSCADAMVAT